MGRGWTPAAKPPTGGDTRLGSGRLRRQRAEAGLGPSPPALGLPRPERGAQCTGQVPLPSSRAYGFPERSRHRRLAFWRQRTMRKEINVFVRPLTFESWSPPIREHFHRGNQLKFKSV